MQLWEATARLAVPPLSTALTRQSPQHVHTPTSGQAHACTHRDNTCVHMHRWARADTRGHAHAQAPRGHVLTQTPGSAQPRQVGGDGSCWVNVCLRIPRRSSPGRPSPTAHTPSAPGVPSRGDCLHLGFVSALLLGKPHPRHSDSPHFCFCFF